MCQPLLWIENLISFRLIFPDNVSCQYRGFCLMLWLSAMANALKVKT